MEILGIIVKFCKYLDIRYTDMIAKVVWAKMPVIILILMTVLIIGCESVQNERTQTVAEGVKCVADSNLRAQNYTDALDCYIRAFEISHETGETEVCAASICDIGIIYATFDDSKSATYYFKKSFELAQKYSHRKVASACVANMILMASAKKDTLLLKEWMNYKREYPIDDNKTDNYWNTYSEALINLGIDNEKSRGLLDKVIHLAEDDKFNNEYKMMAYVDKGTSWLEDGISDSALHYYYRALSLNDNYVNQEKEIYSRLIDIYEKRDIRDSVLKYQTLLLSLQNSSYDISRFNSIRNELINYEELLQKRKVETANERFATMVCVSVPLFVLLLIVIAMHRRLKNAMRLLWEKHNSLMSENEDNRMWKEKFYMLEKKLNDERHSASDNNKETESSLNKEAISCSDKEKLPDPAIPESGNLDESLRHRIDMEILKLLDNKEVLFDPDLTINSLAAMLKVNTSYVSRAISETYGMNFRSFINQRRLEEVCLRLSDNEHYGKLTIAAIANDCGFRSINNFTVVFKKYTGMTPLKYRTMAKDGAATLKVSD